MVLQSVKFQPRELIFISFKVAFVIEAGPRLFVDPIPIFNIKVCCAGRPNVKHVTRTYLFFLKTTRENACHIHITNLLFVTKMRIVIPSKTKEPQVVAVEEREKAAKYKLETGVSYFQLSKWLEKQIGVKVSVSTLSGKFQQKEGQAMFIDGSRHNIRDGEYALLEDFLYKWITYGNISLTRDTVRQKALQNIGIFYPHKKDKISPSNHWLQSFSQRYGIKSFRTSNKRKSVIQKSPRISDERKSATL